MEDRNAFISRVGTFFLLVGVLLMVIFVASDLGKEVQFRYFFMGVIGLLFGFYFKRISAVPNPPSKRFEGLRKARQKQREARQKREDAKKAKQGKR
jgi:hypothetical protein